MNLKVLPYAAALVLPAIASGALTSIGLQKLRNRNKPKKQPAWIRTPLTPLEKNVLRAANIKV